MSAGWGAAHIHRARTACPAGHPYDAANTYVWRDAAGRPHRTCRICGRHRSAEAMRRLRARIKNHQPEGGQ